MFQQFDSGYDDNTIVIISLKRAESHSLVREHILGDVIAAQLPMNVMGKGISFAEKD